MEQEIFLNFLTLSLVNPLFAAMSLVDSSAAFERKCRDLKGGDELFEGLSALGIGDFTTLAFTLGTPQKPPTDDQFDTLGSKVFTNPTLGQLALLRRMHFEATALMVASINEQVKSDRSDPTSLTKRLPAAERQVRLDLQEKRLAGLVDRTLVTRCREMYGNADLFHHLADNGIRTWDMLNSSFHHVITPQDFVDATEDVFLTERTTVQQRLAVQLIVEEGRRMEGTWGAPPPLKRPRTKCEQTEQPDVRPRSNSGSNDAAPLTVDLKPAPASDQDRAGKVIAELKDWSNEDISVHTLAEKIASAEWRAFVMEAVRESVVLIQGPPNAGKSELGVNLARSFQLRRTKTASRLFWFFGRDDPPHLGCYHFCNDSFYTGSSDALDWHKFYQSFHSIVKGEQATTTFSILEGHRILNFRLAQDWVTTTVILTANEELMKSRKTKAESVAKYRDFISSQLDDSTSLINGAAACFIAADQTPATLTIRTISALLRNTFLLPRATEDEGPRPTGGLLF